MYRHETTTYQHERRAEKQGMGLNDLFAPGSDCCEPRGTRQPDLKTLATKHRNMLKSRCTPAKATDGQCLAPKLIEHVHGADARHNLGISKE
jgi:hypothetical protein